MFAGIQSITLFVADVAEVSAWYAKLFGRAPNVAHEHFAMFRFEGFDFCLHVQDEKSKGAAGCQVAYLRVHDIAKACEHWLQAGARIYRDPITTYSERVCQVKDPFGNVIGLLEKLPSS